MAPVPLPELVEIFFLLEQLVPLSHCSDEPLTMVSLPMNYSEVALAIAAEFAHDQMDSFFGDTSLSGSLYGQGPRSRGSHNTAFRVVKSNFVALISIRALAVKLRSEQNGLAERRRTTHARARGWERHGLPEPRRVRVFGKYFELQFMFTVFIMSTVSLCLQYLFERNRSVI